MTLGTYVSPVRTLVTPIDAVMAFRDAIKRLGRGIPKPATVAVLAAQSALESGRWHAMWNFNPSNIKHGSKREGLFTCIKLNERLERNGELVYVWFDPVLGELVSQHGPAKYPNSPHMLPPGEPQCRMRAFETFADGVADKIAFLTRPEYAPAWEAAETGDGFLYATRCKALGYFTAPVGPYARSVVSLAKWILPVAQAQNVEPQPLPPEQEEQLCTDMADCMRMEWPAWLKEKVRQAQAAAAQEAYDEDAAARRAERDAAVAGEGGK